MYSDDLIVKRVPKAVRERTKENMDVYSLGLYDAFNEAVRECATSRSSELVKAWFYSDYRTFIPSAYDPKFLNFRLFPLRYC